MADQKLLEYRDDLKKYKAALYEIVLKDKMFPSAEKKNEVVFELPQVPKPAQSIKRVVSTGISFASELKNFSTSPQANIAKTSIVFDTLFNKNEMEIIERLQYCKEISSPSVQSPQQTPVELRNESEDKTPIEGARYRQVDLEDDKIIAMFTQKEELDTGVCNYEELDQFVSNLLRVRMSSCDCW